VRRLEETGLRYDVIMNSFIASADKTLDMRHGRTTKLAALCGAATGTVASGDDGGKNHGTATPNVGGFTLDDIQQVLIVFY